MVAGLLVFGMSWWMIKPDRLGEFAMYQPEKRPDWLHRIGVGVIVLFVVLVIGGIFVPRTGSRDYKDEKDARQRIAERMTEFPAGKLVRERFPDEFAIMLDKVTAIELDPKLTRAQRDSRIEQENVAMRARNGDHAYFAPSPILMQVLHHVQDDTNLVLTEYGPKVCANYLNVGADALPNMTPKVQASNLNLGAMNILAMAEGRDQPSDRTEATEEDVAELQAAIRNAGVSLDELEASVAGNSGDDACVNMLSILQAAVELSGEAGDRMRAQLVWNAAKPH